MRRSALLILLLLTIWTVTAHAGRIFGDIKMDGKPLPEGVLITLQAVKLDPKGAPQPTPIDSTKTDKVGAYKFMVKEECKCKLTVMYEKQPITMEVFSYKEPTRYDLLLEKKEGKFNLRRK